jgi:hypothetical protein
MKAQSQDTNICENFDSISSLQVTEKEEIDSKKESSQSSKPGIKEIPGRMKGLCINCDDRASCQFPIVEGGVWFCEEYC